MEKVKMKKNFVIMIGIMANKHSKRIMLMKNIVFKIFIVATLVTSLFGSVFTVSAQKRQKSKEEIQAEIQRLEQKKQEDAARRARTAGSNRPQDKASSNNGQYGSSTQTTRQQTTVHTQSSGNSSEFPPLNELNIAIREASNYLNKNIPKGSKIVILNVQSNSSELSDYIIDELIANAVNDKVFTVVDRQQLDAISAEQQFQMSGAVSDNEALEIGKFFGAQTIVSGAVSMIGAVYRIRIRALEVQTAQVQGQFNRNIDSNAKTSNTK